MPCHHTTDAPTFAVEFENAALEVVLPANDGVPGVAKDIMVPVLCHCPVLVSVLPAVFCSVALLPALYLYTR
jgi:hypothetical protein